MHYAVRLLAEDAIATMHAQLPPAVLDQIRALPDAPTIYAFATEEEAEYFLRSHFPELVASRPVMDAFANGVATVRLDVFRSRSEIVDVVVAQVFTEPDDEIEAAAVGFSRGVTPLFNFRLWLPEDAQAKVMEIVDQARSASGDLPS